SIPAISTKQKSSKCWIFVLSISLTDTSVTDIVKFMVTMIPPKHATARYRQWYAKLLRFYPKLYLERFGEGMEQTFNDLCHERIKAGDKLFGFALWTFADTVVGIIKENI